jgi:hypothetical protein
VPEDPENVIHRLAIGDPAAIAEIVERARTSDDVTTMVAAALFTPAAGDLMARATASATTTRERQLVAIAAAHLGGDASRVDDLARDHLVDHPDSVLVAWITAASHHTARTPKDPT